VKHQISFCIYQTLNLYVDLNDGSKMVLKLEYSTNIYYVTKTLMLFNIKEHYILHSKEHAEDGRQGSFDPRDVETVKLGTNKSRKRKESYDYSDTVQVKYIQYLTLCR